MRTHLRISKNENEKTNEKKNQAHSPVSDGDVDDVQNYESKRGDIVATVKAGDNNTAGIKSMLGSISNGGKETGRIK